MLIAISLYLEVRAGVKPAWTALRAAALIAPPTHHGSIIQKYLTDEMRYLCLVYSSNRVTHYSLLDGEYIVAHYAGIVKNVSFGSFLRSLLMIGAPSSIE